MLSFFFIIVQHDVFFSFFACKQLLQGSFYNYVAPKLAYLRMKEGVLDAGTGRVSIEAGLPAGLVGHETVFHRTMGIL